MGAVKSLLHDEICNRCTECGVGLTEADIVHCDNWNCPIPLGRSEADHFINCGSCGQLFDCRDLGEVMRHETAGHEARRPS